MKSIRLLVAIFSSAALLSGTAGAVEIKDVMKAAMKGEDSLFNKVAKGNGTDADAQKLANCVKGLQGTKPPRGDQAAWDRKVAALIKAADSVANGNKQALPMLQNAGACKACHSAHKKE